jgi:hypothetical protein
MFQNHMLECFRSWPWCRRHPSEADAVRDEKANSEKAYALFRTEALEV